MKFKRLLFIAVAGAFALPVAAQVSAGGDRFILAAGGPAGASSTGTGPTGGVPSTRSAGEPAAPSVGTRSAAGGTTSGSMSASPQFSSLDRNNDGMISRAEWDAHYRAGAAAGGATTAPSGSVVSPSGSGKTGTTAGPGESSPRTAPSSDTATSGSTSGTGKAQ